MEAAPTFVLDGKEYMVIEMVWDRNGKLKPTIIYVDENGVNHSIDSGKGKLIFH